MSNSDTPLKKLVFRNPASTDGAPLKALIERCAPLEPNTTYAYVLFCTDFTSTCLLAEDEAGLVGAIVGYSPPSRPDAIFVWQIAVDGRARGAGLGSRMLSALVEGAQSRGIRYVEATVAPTNLASDGLFRRFARDNDVPLDIAPYFSEDFFGVDSHEPEHLYRIGPIAPEKHKENQ